MATAARPKTDSPREHVGTAATEVFDLAYWRGIAETVQQMVKGYRTDFDCPECGHRKTVLVPVPDVAGQIKAAKEMLEEAYGRPGTASGEPGGVVIVVERTWPSAGAEDRHELQPAATAGGVSPIQG